jgi:hypothetical protein
VKEWLTVGAAAELDLCWGALEVACEDFPHAGVGADPLGAMDGWAKALGAAAFSGVEGG